MENVRLPRPDCINWLDEGPLSPYVDAFKLYLTDRGYESPNTTHRYVEADLGMKERALARLEAPDTKMRPFRPSDSLMRFLQTL